MKNLFGFGPVARDGVGLMNQPGLARNRACSQIKANQLAFLALVESIEPTEYERRLRLAASAQLMKAQDPDKRVSWRRQVG